MNPTDPSVAPAATPSSKTTAPPYKLEAGILYAQDHVDLPDRCLSCGDTVDLTRLRTFPGQVRYHICREHLITAVALIAAGLIVAGVGLWHVAGPLLNGGYTTWSSRLFFFALMLGGLALAAWGVPLHAGRLRNGYRRLWFAGKLKNI